MAPSKQAIHGLLTVLSAPDLVLSGSDGQVRGPGPQGWYSRDRRALARLEFELPGFEQVTVGRRRTGPDAVTVHSVVTALSDRTTDPTADRPLLANRHRAVSAAALAERLTLTNFGTGAVRLTLRAHTGTDLAGLDAVRSGRLTRPVPPLSHGGDVRWEGVNITVSLRCTPEPDTVDLDADGAELTWLITLDPGDSWSVRLTAGCAQGRPVGFAPTAASRRPQWTVGELPVGTADLVAANLADLDALLLADPDDQDDRFTAAGAPWYLTLFGRDALWTARMLLPVGPELAGGTLRTLARRQGQRLDPGTEEAPGKILHEARPDPLRVGQLRLPPVYYGTIDATALWVLLLHDAWRAGMPAGEVAALLPNLVAALDWITGPHADPDGDGLLEYTGSADGGLGNQGWKDSADGIRHGDGRLAAAPLALCEVQGYAYAAALGAAALAEEFGLPHGPAWLAWAARLREVFHAAFWLTDDVGSYPAIALDAGKRPVAGASSNIGHLLGTGLLDAGQAERVAHRLAAPDLTTGYGLRTLSSDCAAYHPLSYHLGSVWPHDTAIAILGANAEGQHELADVLADGLLRAARHFAGRPPELYGVLDGEPVRYPSACRPQAWSAAAIVVAALTVNPTARTTGPGGAASATGRR
ncbi:MAG TPA: glycogen debranching N-terminal domain-containing protein [Actinophytocola sp.]|uniref:glycogen debranching N-terminal domain-containing protein n=1 Tax=Actinophytocola sp. TaxID=1872138 RepID=UPI002DB90C79|nr:glycogen debranching N-terminal domain-containing protein [Actinophytocola sp.]HEU5472517.1 glycogen debranching N-terminal domain-containing protein [Actinophytocola sp.]